MWPVTSISHLKSPQTPSFLGATRSAVCHPYGVLKSGGAAKRSTFGLQSAHQTQTPMLLLCVIRLGFGPWASAAQGMLHPP